MQLNLCKYHTRHNSTRCGISQINPAMTQFPTQSTPGGCLLGLLGGFFAVLGILGGWAFRLWLKLPADERMFDGTFWISVGATTIGSAAAAILWLLAVRTLRNTDFRGYDSRDPDNKGIKW